LVTLRPSQQATAQPSKKRAKSRLPSDNHEHIQQLERELQYLQQSHQITLEELETSNEELKSSFEELQSTNEELQSTNEELETSKEEMQSLNEELTTVNAELQSKLDELSQSNDDMKNLLNSTDIATVFLDSELNIKRFTQQARDLVMLRSTDVGRPISELASNMEYKDLAVDCQAVLKTLVLKECEVRTKGGVWYLMRIMPYRTVDNVIDGLVLTFVDIQRLKAGEQARAYFESIVNTVREPLVILNAELRVLTANQSFYRTFHTSPKLTEGELIYELGAGQWDVPKLRELLEAVLPAQTNVENYEIEVNLPKVGRRVFSLNARRLDPSAGVGDLILLALEDATPNSNSQEKSN
jgi:two-component system CheB/CheR fusion protein